MRVKKLISLLEAIDGNEEVIIASDAEGNSFHGVYEVVEIDGKLVIWPNDDIMAFEEE